MGFSFGPKGFDSTQETGTFGDFTPLPAGRYLAMVTESDQKPTKNGAGSYCEITFTVQGGQYAGRKLVTRLNLDHPNDQTVQIARTELAAICKATGVMRPRDAADLHDIPLVIEVKVEPRNDQPDKYTNRIKGYYARSSDEGKALQAQQAQTTKSGW